MTDNVENLTTKTENLEINSKFDKWNDLPTEVKSEYLKSIEAEKSSPTSDKIVKLNIGGTVFQTSKSTLTKFDGFFKTMLETDVPISKDESGAIFIDRPAQHFELILNYMRDGYVEVPVKIRKVRQLHIEARYYQLTGLIQLCDVEIYKDNLLKIWKIPPEGNVKINIGGTMFETTKLMWTIRSSKIKNILEAQELAAFDKSGNIFIDRSPKNFDRIFYIITKGKQLVLSTQERDELFEEAEFYGVPTSFLNSVTTFRW